MALSVQEILDLDIPSPSWAWNPTKAAPLRSDFEEYDVPGDTHRTLDLSSNQFKTVGTDTPRIYGANQDLVVEGVDVTNHVDWSSDFSHWGEEQATITDSTLPSVVKGESAARVSPDHPDTYDQIYEYTGTFSNDNRECVAAIIESDTADAAGIGIENNGQEQYATYDFTASAGNKIGKMETSGFTTDYQGYAHEFDFEGPNGGTLVYLELVYKNENADTDNRKIVFLPDVNETGGASIIHHGQVLERKRGSITPIVTQGSAVTQAAEYPSITLLNVPSWVNPNEGTIILEYEPYWVNDDASLVGSIDLFNINQFNLFTDGSDTISMWNGTVSEVSVLSNKQVLSPFTTRTVAFSYSPNDMALATQGQANNRGSPPNQKIGSIDYLTIRKNEMGLMAYKNMQYIPKFLSNDKLKALTV